MNTEHVITAGLLALLSLLPVHALAADSTRTASIARVTLTKGIQAPVVRNGQTSGTLTIQAEAEVRLMRDAGPVLTVEHEGTRFDIERSFTDLDDRLKAAECARDLRAKCAWVTGVYRQRMATIQQQQGTEAAAEAATAAAAFPTDLFNAAVAMYRQTNGQAAKPVGAVARGTVVFGFNWLPLTGSGVELLSSVSATAKGRTVIVYRRRLDPDDIKKIKKKVKEDAAAGFGYKWNPDWPKQVESVQRESKKKGGARDGSTIAVWVDGLGDDPSGVAGTGRGPTGELAMRHKTELGQYRGVEQALTDLNNDVAKAETALFQVRRVPETLSMTFKDHSAQVERRIADIYHRLDALAETTGRRFPNEGPLPPWLEASAVNGARIVPVETGGNKETGIRQ